MPWPEPTWRSDPVEAGALFPAGRFGFTVHSVFEHAVNLRAEREPWLVSLVTRPQSLHPRAAVVRGALKGFEVGRRGAYDVPEGLIRRSCRMPDTRVRVDGLGAAVDAARRAKGLSEGPFAGLLERGREALAGSFAEGVAVLLGAGQGLTPAGDDALVGWLAALWARGREDREDAGRFLRGQLHRTNEVSAAFLASAAEGRFSLALVDLASAAARGNGVSRALDALAHVGHSSGLDAAWGLAAGLEMLE